jgi:hypothetical protein
MTTNELRRALFADPFRPFTVRMADDREFPVPHRDFFFIHPAGRTAIIATIDDEAFEIVDILLISSLHFGNGARPTRRRRRG